MAGVHQDILALSDFKNPQVFRKIEFGPKLFLFPFSIILPGGFLIVVFPDDDKVVQSLGQKNGPAFLSLLRPGVSS
jgi:hypothetical protein